MKYVRFQSQQPCLGTASKLGVFQIAFEVRNSPEINAYDASEIMRHINWLKQNLHSPDLDDQDYRAIFWFKDSAREPMRHIWAIKPYLEAYGHWIEVIKTWTPGKIVYEDSWQVAAKPWRRMR